MQVKIVTHFLVVSYLLSSLASAYPGGCYECEEEVWEEVPCDEIPSNSTTIEPPPFVHPTPCHSTTSTPMPEPPCTTTSTTTSTTTPSTTTSTSTTTTTTTTTTPNPIETTPVSDTYKKCYCECKAGCKEFCRKVVVNPEVKKQIVQISEISEPVPQGRVESTHYHHRKLIPNFQEDGSLEDSDSYTRQGADKPRAYASLLPTTSQAAVNKVPKMYNSNFIPSITYYSNPADTDQVSPNNYAHAQADLNDLSYTNQHQTYFYASPPSELFDFPMPPLQGVYSKSMLGPEAHNIKVSVTSSNSIPNIPDFGLLSQSSGPYSSLAPVKSSQVTLTGPAISDDSFDTYLKDLISDSRLPHFGTYETHSGPHYSLSYR